MSQVCVNPEAPIVKCVICESPVHTCERVVAGDENEGGDYRCPAHPGGVEISTEKGWVCSSECWGQHCNLELQDQLVARDAQIQQLQADWLKCRAAVSAQPHTQSNGGEASKAGEPSEK